MQQAVGVGGEEGGIPIGVVVNAHAEGVGLGQHFIGIGIALVETQGYGFSFCLGAQLNPAAHRDRLAQLHGLRFRHSPGALTWNQASEAVFVEFEQVQIVGHRLAAIGMNRT